MGASWRYHLQTQDREVELADGEISLGRSQSCTVPIKDGSISRNHAQLHIRDGRVTLRDLNSSNGTFLNGTRVQGEAEVHDGDRIMLGESQMTMRISPPEDVAATMRIDASQLLAEEEARLEAQANAAAAALAVPELPAPPAPVAPGPSRSGPMPSSLAQPSAPPADAHPEPPVPLSPLAAKRAAEAVMAPSSPAVARPPAPPPAPARTPAPPPAPRTPAPPVPAPPRAAAPPAPAPAGPKSSLPDFDLPPLPPVAAAAPAAATARPRPTGGPLPVARPGAGGQPAGFWIRLAAYLIDGLLIAVVILPLAFLLRKLLGPVGAIISLLINLVVGFGFPFFCWTQWGATPGKRLLGLAVVPFGSTKPGLTYQQAALRVVGYIASAVPLYAGFIMVGFMDGKRGLHDLIAGTSVIRSK